jgi:hypothetical protein
MEQGETVATQTAKATNVAVIALSVIVLALIGVIGVLVYKQTDVTKNDTATTTANKENEKEDSKTTNSVTENRTDSTTNGSATTDNTPSNQDLNESNPSTNSSDESAPSNWREVENSAYDYTAYIPPTYYYRFFDSARIVGIDTNELPEASEYMGIITINIERSSSVETTLNNNIRDWVAISTATEVHSNGRWSIVHGTIPANEMFEEKEVITAYIQHGEYVLSVEYRNAPSDFGTYEDIFDTVYQSLKLQ